MPIILKIILKQILNILSYFFVKNENIWLISLYNGGGSEIAENSYALCHYLKKIKKVTFRYIYSKPIDGLQENFVKLYSFKYFYYILIAKVLIVESDLHNDLPFSLKKETLKVNIFHGLATKKIYFSSKYISKIYEKNLKNLVKEILVGFCFPNEYNLILTSNNFHRMKYIEAFKNKNVFISGQSRNDILLKSKKKQLIKKLIKKYKIVKNKKKIILYLPTFRDKNLKPKLNTFLSDKKLNNYLNKKNYIMLVKEHSFYERNIKNYTKTIDSSKNNIIIIDNDFLTQELLVLSDLLINDYSGIYFDYLLLKKPIIFFCYDYKAYVKKHRSLYIDYFNDKYTPGDKVHQVSSLIKSIEKNLNNKFLYYKKIIRAKNFFHKFTDGNNSKRVYKLIQKYNK